MLILNLLYGAGFKEYQNGNTFREVFCFLIGLFCFSISAKKKKLMDN